MNFPSLKGALAILIFVSIFLSLTALGVAAIATKEPSPRWSRAGMLSELVPGGPPLKTLVVRIHRDHWVRYPDEPIGYAFLRRTADDEIVALRGDHSQYHVPVEFNEQRGVFELCCWMSQFDLEGRELPPHWRNENLHRLPVKIDGDQVFVDLSEQPYGRR